MRGGKSVAESDKRAVEKAKRRENKGEENKLSAGKK